MDVARIRTRSLERAAALGFTVNPDLPLLDDDLQLRPLDRVLDRTLCVFVVAFCAWGLSGSLCLAWLRQEHLLADLTEEEADFLEHSDGEEEEEYFWYVEALWALMWTLGKVDQLDVQVPVSDELVSMLPKVHDLESSPAFRSSVVLRPQEEIAAALDLHYCLHWAIRQREVELDT